MLVYNVVCFEKKHEAEHFEHGFFQCANFKTDNSDRMVNGLLL